MISNNAIEPFPTGAETEVPHDGPAVGATLVVAHDNVAARGKMPARDRATTRVAPTGCPDTRRYNLTARETDLEGPVE
jgi:hypothetical protein